MNTLTPLEYFAAHAPATPADWFEPVFTPIKIPAKPEGAEWCDGCKAGADCYKTKECLDYKAWWDDKETRESCNEFEEARARAAQWPWAWAKSVLETHPICPPKPVQVFTIEALRQFAAAVYDSVLNVKEDSHGADIYALHEACAQLDKALKGELEEVRPD